VDLRELDQKQGYGDFYAPAFQVKVAGQDLVRDLYLSVTGVELDLTENTPGRFSFTVANAFDWQKRDFVARQNDETIDLIELFAFGGSVEVRLGYGEPKKLKPLMDGIITEIGTSFSEGSAPDLTVSGYDVLYPLTTGRRSQDWEGERDSDLLDSDVVARIVGPLKVTANIVKTKAGRPRIDQSQQTDMDFLRKLARQNGATFYVRDGEFYFGPRNNDESEVVELTWGKGLLGFTPEANLGKQVSAVEVHGRSDPGGEPIVGRASRGDESGRDIRRESGGQRVTAALSGERVMSIRAPGHNQGEADERARTELEERSQEFVTSRGECIGLPDIVPDINISISGIGRTFSKVYYVHQATHRVDGNGYRTSFQVKESTI
jgi:phage protein D